MARVNSLNINRLNKYNFTYISVEEVIVLEYLLAYQQKNALEVVMPNRIETETGLKRSKINHAIDELVQKELVIIHPKKIKGRFSVAIENVVAQFDKIFSRPNKYAMQYFLYVQNPNSFKTNALKAKRAKAMAKSKPKQMEGALQMSLF